MANSVALKLPDLWTDNVEAWFAQAESQFALRDITRETTKYHYVVSALNAQTAKRLNALLNRELSATPFTDIKRHLLAKFSRTPFERAAAINGVCSLGDWKPSELMDHLLSLLGDHEPDLMFRYHFFQCLPDYVRSTLAFSETTDPNQLAEEADRIFVAGRPKDASVNETSMDASVDRVMTGAKRTPFRRNAQTTSSTPQRALCYYHARFGEEALRCRGQCSWSSMQGNGARGPQQ
jgi:hypothetical protein